jgi:hypothetical protein
MNLLGYNYVCLIGNERDLFAFWIDNFYLGGIKFACLVNGSDLHFEWLIFIWMEMELSCLSGKEGDLFAF